jgi:hypothetical protein
MHGLQYNDFISRNFIISFDPRNYSTRDGFITIINTKNNIEKFQNDADDICQFIMLFDDCG